MSTKMKTWVRPAIEELDIDKTLNGTFNGLTEQLFDGNGTPIPQFPHWGTLPNP